MSGHVTSLEDALAAGTLLGTRFHEFLRVPALSAGVYRLGASEEDPQGPHNQDEIYYVVRGQAVLDIAGQDWPVEPGSIAHVPARVPHHFHSIAEELHVLVIFAPAESSGGS